MITQNEAVTAETNNQATKSQRIVGKLSGKYAAPAVYFYDSLRYYFGLSPVMAQVAAEAFMSDAGRAQCTVDGVSIGKAKKADGSVKWSESGETKLAETYAMRMYRACTSLDKVRKESGLDASSFKGKLALHELCNTWLAEKTTEALARYDYVDKDGNPVSA